MQSGSRVAASSRLGMRALPWPRTLLVAGGEFLPPPLRGCVGRPVYGFSLELEMDGKSVDAPVGAGARWPVCRLPVRRATALRRTKLPAAASLPGRGPARVDDVSQGPGGVGKHMLLLSKAMGAEGEAAPCLPVGTAKRRAREGQLQSWGWSVSTLNLGVLGVCGSEKSCFASPGGFGGGESQ